MPKFDHRTQVFEQVGLNTSCEINHTAKLSHWAFLDYLCLTADADIDFWLHEISGTPLLQTVSFLL